MLYVNSDETPSDSTEAIPVDDNAVSETHSYISSFWPSVMEEMKKIKHVDAKNQVLPLARIKKIMKLDEDVKMISAEAPLLFAKASEIFIHELTLRAWVHTEDNKRRTLQKNDIAMAITKYDQFDFLIDIVPRDEIKPKKETETKCVINDQNQYYYQIAQQTLQQGTANVASTTQSNPIATPALQIHSPTGQPVAIAAPQNIIVANNQPAQVALVNNVQQSQPATGQQIQLVQQIVTPSGEITHIPISPSQLNLLRMQMQNNTSATPIIIQAPQIHQQQTAQLVHSGQTPLTTIYQNTPRKEE